MRRQRNCAMISLLSIAVSASGFAQAQPKNATVEALQIIRETADSICVGVAQSGRQSRVELSGDIKAKVSGLAQKLADIGVAGAGKFEESQHEGLLQEQLADALKDVRNCKTNVFLTLIDRMIPKGPLPSPRDPDGLYQYGEKVAEGSGAVINQANGFVQFQAIRTFGKADPNREVEFRDWVLTCPQLPTPPRNAFVGQYSGVVAGGSCTIVRKAD